MVCHSGRLLLVLCGLVACFSVACTTPTKSLAKYDQVLQLGPFFFPNLSGKRLRIDLTAECILQTLVAAAPAVRG